MDPYQPFIDDPKHIALLKGQRYVVLRPTGDVRDVHSQVRALARDRLAEYDVSYPACAHVTLAGFRAGTDLDALREVVRNWAATVAPLQLEVERVHHFPSPFQIVMVQIRRTPELFDALASLRERARESGFPDLSPIQSADWTFHMSVAYCSALNPSTWGDVSGFFESVTVPPAHCTVGDVEIVTFNEGREEQGGCFDLSA